MHPGSIPGRASKNSMFSRHYRTAPFLTPIRGWSGLERALGFRIVPIDNLVNLGCNLRMVLEQIEVGVLVILGAFLTLGAVGMGAYLCTQPGPVLRAIDRFNYRRYKKRRGI